MKASHFFQALALGSLFLASFANACGLRDNGGTYINPVTGMEIQKCHVGQSWAGSSCSGNPIGGKFRDVVARYGQGEWRLITEEEARRVVSRFKNCPILAEVGQHTFFTSTPHPNYPTLGSTVFFYNREAGVSNDEFAFVRLVRPGQTSGGAAASNNNTTPSSNTATNLDTPERLQAAQANQQQADRAFAGKKRTHDDSAITEQPTTGSREGTATNSGPVRVNVAYCMDSYKRAYSGSLKCSAQRFGYTSVEPGQTVDVLGPNSGLQALTFGCKHPAKPYDVEFVNDGLSGRCAAY